MTLKQQQKTNEMVKNNKRWAKTLTEMRTVTNAVKNLHVWSPLLSSHWPPPKTFPVKALWLGNSHKWPPLVSGTLLAPQYKWNYRFEFQTHHPPTPKRDSRKSFCPCTCTKKVKNIYILKVLLLSKLFYIKFITCLDLLVQTIFPTVLLTSSVDPWG